MIFYLPTRLEDFVNFGLIYAFDVGQFLFGRHDDTGDCAKTAAFEFGNIGGIDAVLL